MIRAERPHPLWVCCGTSLLKMRYLDPLGSRQQDPKQTHLLQGSPRESLLLRTDPERSPLYRARGSRYLIVEELIKSRRPWWIWS